MSAVALASLEAAGVLTPQPHHVRAAERHLREIHAGRDCELTYGAMAELAWRRASDPAFQALVDAARADLLERLDVLGRRIHALLERAKRVDTRNPGEVAVFLRRDLVLTLGDDREVASS